MSSQSLEALARAVLNEGNARNPNRPTTLKYRQRWTDGGR